MKNKQNINTYTKNKELQCVFLLLDREQFHIDWRWDFEGLLGYYCSIDDLEWIHFFRMAVKA
jgi:hypothetical protein